MLTLHFVVCLLLVANQIFHKCWITAFWLKAELRFMASNLAWF